MSVYVKNTITIRKNVFAISVQFQKFLKVAEIYKKKSKIYEY